MTMSMRLSILEIWDAHAVLSIQRVTFTLNLLIISYNYAILSEKGIIMRFQYSMYNTPWTRELFSPKIPI